MSTLSQVMIKIMKNYCKKCASFVNEELNEDGFCPACVEAIAKGKAQTEKIEAKEKADKQADGQVEKVE